MSFVERYRSTCDDVRTIARNAPIPGRSVLAEFHNDQSFLAAIGSLCAFGDFQLDESAADATCAKQRALEPRHIAFLNNIALVKTDTPLRRVFLRCVELPQPLLLHNLRAESLQLTDVVAERVMLAFSKLSVSIMIEGSTFRRGFAVYASDIAVLMQLAKSRVGTDKGWDFALGTVASTFGEIALRDVAIDGAVHFSAVTTARSLALQNNSTVAGDLRLTDARIGGFLGITSTTIKGAAQLNYLTALRAALENATFEQRVLLNHAKIDRQLSVHNSKLNKGLYGAFLQAPELRVSQTEIGGSLNFSYAQAGTLEITRVKSMSDPCKDCDLVVYGATVGNLSIEDFDGTSVLAGDGRFNTLDVRRGSIGRLHCEDCQISQYALLATKIRDRAELKGTEIKGTFALSLGRDKVCWGHGSFLDIAELKADVLAVNARDLIIEPTPNPGTDCVSPETDPTAAFVATRLTGARYRTITGGRASLAALKAAAPAERKAMTAPAMTDMEEQRLIEFVQGRKSIASTGYDPQPYEEMAAALSRAGETEKATALRVARIDERIATTNVGLIERAWFRVYRLLSDYGYKNERVTFLFIMLLAVGMVVHLRGCGFGSLDAMVACRKRELLGRFLFSFWYALDRAIPPLNLELLRRDEPGLSWATTNYFYLHRVIGTSLISVFAAGAAGLGQ